MVVVRTGEIHSSLGKLEMDEEVVFEDKECLLHLTIIKIAERCHHFTGMEG